MKWAWLIVLAAGPVWGGSLRSVPGKNWDKSDAAAVNVNFQKVDQSLGNTVTKTGTQTIVGEKTFGTVKVTSGTVTTLNSTTGNITTLTATTATVTNLTATNATITNLTATNIVGAYASGMKNMIINGDMKIDQRSAGAVKTLTGGVGTYSIDRFYGEQGGSNVTHQRVASTLTGFPYALHVVGAAGNTHLWVNQRVESANIEHAAGKNVTFSAYIAASDLTFVYMSVFLPNATDNYSATTLVVNQPIAVTSTLTRYSVTFSTTGWARGAQFLIATPSGVGAGQSIMTTGWQVELGDTATAFEHRPREVELSLCQRYFQKSWNLGTAIGTGGGNGFRYGYSATGWDFYCMGYVFFKTSMRVSPTVVIYNWNTGAGGTMHNATNGLAYPGVGREPNQHQFRIGGDGTMIVNHYYMSHWLADAEL